MSNAGDDESVVLNQLRDAALARHDDSLCILEWSAEDGCELDDQRAWAQANPGLGYIISESAIRSALTDPPEIFRTEVLCQRVAHLDSAIDAAAWKDCADPGATMDGLRDRTAACFDVAEDGQHATLAVAARLSTGQIRTEIAGAWDSTAQARDELPLLLARIKPRAFAWYPAGPAAALKPHAGAPQVASATPYPQRAPFRISSSRPATYVTHSHRVSNARSTANLGREILNGNLCEVERPLEPPRGSEAAGEGEPG